MTEWVVDLALLESFMWQQALVFPPGDAGAMPPMVAIFGWLRTAAGLPPTQERFVQAVGARALEDEDGTRARAARTYPSLIRQLHFYSMVRERTRFEGVNWLADWDMHGVDILVLHQGIALGVSLSMRSEAAWQWAKVKASRHPPIKGLRMLHLDVELATAPRIGPFAVHPGSDVAEIQQAMELLLLSRLPPETTWRKLFVDAKASRRLRAKAAFGDVAPVLETLYGKVRRLDDH